MRTNVRLELLHLLYSTLDAEGLNEVHTIMDQKILGNMMIIEFALFLDIFFSPSRLATIDLRNK